MFLIDTQWNQQNQWPPWLSITLHRPVALSIFERHCPPQQQLSMGQRLGNGLLSGNGWRVQAVKGWSPAVARLLNKRQVLSDGLVRWGKILWISWIASQSHTQSQQTRWNSRTYNLSNLAQGFPRLSENMFAANPTFARTGSRISLDMLKSIRKVSVFSTLQNLQR